MNFAFRSNVFLRRLYFQSPCIMFWCKNNSVPLTDYIHRVDSHITLVLNDPSIVSGHFDVIWSQMVKVVAGHE